MDTTTLEKGDRAGVLPGFGATAALAALSACGGGGTSGSGTAPAQGVPPAAPVMLKHTPEEASRFLAQAAIGATRPLIDSVASGGIEAWIDRQFEVPRAIDSNLKWLDREGFTTHDYRFDQEVWQKPMWKGLFTGPDQLRQRVTLALMDMFPVGIRTIDPYWRAAAMANYHDVLADNAFGNFRSLLEAITYSTAMGSFLTYIGSRKADGKGRLPDENYAREIMQLFTIGLEWLEEDGSLRLDGAGRPMPTYFQNDVSQMARIFTGLTYAAGDRESYERHGKRLELNLANNDPGPVSFLGITVSGGGETALKATLDALFYHPNTAPFFGRRLIQSLVTSNPSPAYIKRVARAFADTGGVRGDLRAVIKAVLLDPEARAAPSGNPGRLRSPVERFLNWGRAFSVSDAKNTWTMPGVLVALGHSPGWSPTVFNFFRPGFSPPLTQIREQGLLAPEFELTSEQKVLSYVNFMKRAVGNEFAFWGLTPDHSAYLPLADQPRRLVDELALVLAAGQLSEGTRQSVSSAVSAISPRDDRIRLASLLVLASPEYLVLE